MNRVQIQVLVSILCAAAALPGCPGTGFGPTLNASPVVVSFGSTGQVENIAIYNAGSGTLEWSLMASVPWVTADVTSGATTTGTDQVELTADRSGLAPGTYNGSVTINSNGGSRVIPIAMVVPGTPVLSVTPSSVNFNIGSSGGTPTEEIVVGNGGDDSLAWQLVVLDPDNPGGTIAIPDYLSIKPTGALTPAGGETPVTITVDGASLASQGVGTFSLTLEIRSAAGNRTVTLNFLVGTGAEIAVSPTTLDFGTQLNVLQFEVWNNGGAGSILNFSVGTDRPDLILPAPTSGVSQGVASQNLVDKDRQTIAVTIDRSALEAQSDSGKVIITAPGSEPVEVTVLVTSAPLVFEGAQNRSRPPFLLRFVFLLRDALGEAIDTLDPDIFAELQNAFSVDEDGVPLDTNETNLFVTSAANLRYNVVLLLDYTGSMFNAGVGNGAVIQQMENASQDFIDDLPATYRIALMEYHERQQTQRLIQGFTTDKATLKTALDNFSVPVGAHGASEVREALMDAIRRLENEDIDTLAFDDVDVRALVFVTDGRDTSSPTTLDQVIEAARDARVRLYPIGFGSSVQAAPLVQMATSTGGHYYPAPTQTALISALGHETGAPANAPGVVVKDLARQIVLTYPTLVQDGNHTYLIRASFRGLDGQFEEDAVVALGGDVRAGQITLRTAGIQPDGTAVVEIRAEYIPRDVSQIRFRIISPRPDYTVEITPNGLLEGWTLVDETGVNEIFTVLTSETTPLRYGSFGDLIRVRYTSLPVNDEFEMGFRVDNRVYVNPPFTKFFQYPDAIIVGGGTNQESVTPILLSDGFDPDEPGAFDRDDDGAADFADLFPDDPNHS